uniref:bcl-2-like protein 11 isoform X2 n=1 Tax=Scatophagus argus TaxID=75038 RepID=UPI001ED80D0B|nr:bcl-2-like protein 11 isoform X2 [Scatophagus argus]
MNPPSRPPNRCDASTAVAAAQESGGDPPPGVAAGAQISLSDNSGERSVGQPSSTGAGEPDSPSWCRTKPISRFDSLGAFQMRSIFHLPRRASSGYFSYDSDSLPSSPVSPRPPTADRATQTPSPTGQVIEHALQRMAEAHGGGPGRHQQHGHSPGHSSTQPEIATGSMQAEAIGQELRRIGDDFNRLLLLRRVEGRPVVIPPNPLPHIHQEPAMLLCVGLLLLLIGRVIYLQGSTGSQDLSQV